MRKTITSRNYLKLMSWLKTARLEKDLTVRELGRRINKPHQFVSKIECGERRLDVFEYVQYCAALGVDSKEGLDILSQKI